LTDVDFLTKVTAEGRWLFKPYELRKKIFECAKIADVHAYEKKKNFFGL